MGSKENSLRKKWQDYSGYYATKAEDSVYDIFMSFFKDTEYTIIKQPSLFKSIYVDVKLSPEEQSEIYTPLQKIKKHGIVPDCAITNNKTGKTIFVEIKRQDGWVEGKLRKAGRGNAHERLCKYFTPGLTKLLRTEGKIAENQYPFWIIFQGDITRDPCRVREIRYWFDGNDTNLFFWRNVSDAAKLIHHFIDKIVPLLE